MARGKVFSEYIGLLDDDYRRQLECERSPGPSHVEDGGGDARQLVPNHGLHRASYGQTPGYTLQ
jgi:hypothetical protein